MTPPPNDVPVVIAVDDDPDHGFLLAKSLRRGATSGRVAIDPTILTFTDPIEAITALPADRLAVVLLDYRLHDSTALDWLGEFTQRGAGPVIIMTSQGDECIATEALKNGASDYLVKSHIVKDPELLYQAIGQALRRHKLVVRNRELSVQLKVANRGLKHRNERLAELTDTAHRFVDDVAHEFRTPLAVIQEFTSIVSDGIGGPVTDKQAEFLRYIASATSDLAQMVDDFLDSSRLKQRTLRVSRRPNDLSALFDQVRPTLQTRAAGKGIQLEEHLADGLPPVFCDLEKAGRALVNLAVNAIKFSPADSTVRLIARPNADGGACVEVVDNGPGIEQTDLARITARFGQASIGVTNKIKGFGLGLSIASELIRLNLGRMRVTSEAGRGSTFGFTLPSHEPTHILDRYLATVSERDDVSALSALRVTTPDRSVTVDEAWSFLTSVCYPMDLALPLHDRGEIVVLGACEKPTPWIDRLTAAWDASDHGGAAAPTMGVLGTWLPAEFELVLRPGVIAHVGGMRDCA